MKKTIFWNVDTQYDFMKEEDGPFLGALPIPKAKTIECNLQYITNLAEEKNIQVVNTGDWHHEDSKEFSEDPDMMNTFPKHCIRGTKGAEFIPATQPWNPYMVHWTYEKINEQKVKDERNITIYKDAFDVFTGSPHTDKVLEIINPDRVMVYGVATNVCVDYAVMGLLERGIKVYVVENAIKELPDLPLEETLDKWTSNGAKLIKTTSLESYL